MEDERSKKDPKILIQLAKQGDKEAFDLLYDMYFVPVFRYVYFRVDSKTEAEDLVQEVFIRVYKNLEKFQDRNKSPLAYFFTVARNLIIDYWRNKKEKLFDKEDILTGLPDKNSDPLQLIEKKETQKAIRKEIKDLTPEQQEVIVLKFINGMSNKEIAILLNKTEEAIRQLQCRALKILRKKLKDLKIL